MEVYLGECLKVMVQALHAQDDTLPPGLTVQNMYTELMKGQQEGSSGGAEQHCLPPNSPERRPLWQGQWPYNQYPKPPSLGVYRFKMKCVLTPKPQSC